MDENAPPAALVAERRAQAADAALARERSAVALMHTSYDWFKRTTEVSDARLHSEFCAEKARADASEAKFRAARRRLRAEAVIRSILADARLARMSQASAQRAAVANVLVETAFARADMAERRAAAAEERVAAAIKRAAVAEERAAAAEERAAAADERAERRVAEVKAHALQGRADVHADPMIAHAGRRVMDIMAETIAGGVEARIAALRDSSRPSD
jgi:hypothetical protein